MKRITEFLAKLNQCEFVPLDTNQPLYEASYNNVRYDQSTETYERIIEDSFTEFQTAILELSIKDNTKQILHRIEEDLRSVQEKFFDIPSADALQASQSAYTIDKNPEILKEIQEIKFIRAMHDVQTNATRRALHYIESFLNQHNDISTVEKEPVPEGTKNPEPLTKESKRKSKNKKEDLQLSPEEQHRKDELLKLEKEIYTLDEVELMLGMTKNTLKKWKDNGYLTYSQPNGSSKVWITKEAIKAFMEHKEILHKAWK